MTTPTAPAARTPRIVVLGALTVELITRIERFPEPGETLEARSFTTQVGGRGLNQATAAARQGAQVALIGRVGADPFGQMLRSAAQQARINVKHVLTSAGMHSGITTILDGNGRRYATLVAVGANGHVEPADVEAARGLIAGADLLLVQLEIPLDAVRAAAALAQSVGTRLMLAAAPPQVLPPDLLKQVDILVASRAGISAVLAEASHEPETDACRVLQIGPRLVVVTLGNRGALYAELERGERKIQYVPAVSVRVVDTGGAGDAFAGGLAVALAGGTPPDAAVRRAAACGALACTAIGVEPALPYRAAVDALVAKAARPDTSK